MISRWARRRYCTPIRSVEPDEVVEQPVVRGIEGVEGKAGEKGEHADPVNAGVGHLLQRIVADVVGPPVEAAKQVVLHHLEEILQVARLHREEGVPALVLVRGEKEPGDADNGGRKKEPGRAEV